MTPVASDPVRGALLLSPHDGILSDLAARPRVRLGPLALPGGASVDLELGQVDLNRLDLGLRVNGGFATLSPRDVRLSVWKGTVAGDPRSDVLLALSSHGCRGWIHGVGGSWELLAEPGAGGDWGASRARLVPAAELAAASQARDAGCFGTLRAPGGWTPPAPPSPGDGSGMLHCAVAVETDWQLFALFDDAQAELAYLASLLAAVSAQYEAQLDVVLTFPFVELWTVPADPWVAPDVGGSTLDMLNELQAYWAPGKPAGARLGHMLSGADLGGGIAWLDVLCDAAYGYSVSANLTEFGLTPFPPVQGPLTWDFFVMAHELGHNFGAEHTHELCPPLDECAPSGFFGACQSQQACTSQGTLMSYCHQCPGGMSNIALQFHPAQVPAMRAAAEACLSAGCTGGLGTVRAQAKIDSTQGGFVPLSALDVFGQNLAALGDLDGDGVTELAVSAVLDDQAGANAGAAYVLFLDPDGGAKSVRKITQGAGGFMGPLAPGDQFGYVEALGDLDGDGVADLAAGAALDDQAGANAGALWILFLNPDGTVKAQRKVTEGLSGFTGVLNDGDEFGDGVARLGDLDGDGVTELAVGSVMSDAAGPDEGAVWILFLNADGTVKAQHVVAEGLAGFAGPTSTNVRFGRGLATIGDLDGDHLPELAVGASQDEAGQGVVWVLSLDAAGQVRWQQRLGEGQGGFTGTLAVNDLFGQGLGAPGDLDADGEPDLCVGAPEDDSGGDSRGAVYVLFLNPNGTVREWREISSDSGCFAGPLQDGDQFGYAEGLGDLDGDDVPDLAVGARLGNGLSPDEGAVWVLFMDHGAWVDVGHGLPGTDGIQPTMGGEGALAAGSYMLLEVRDAAWPTLATLVMGLSALEAPFKGGVLVPTPHLVYGGIPVAGGGFDLGGFLPASVPSGAQLWFQTWVPDPGAPKGVSATNALRAEFP